ncbi:hypothetical protein ACJ6WF_01955 [Streptomyces sp. MMS24-I2-30]|uniref:hypothetical protein n=1 Tax=Streptomyces sp. MMS24-I2-30 TaxID=3351564 RepID=UPI003896B809
MCEAIADVAIRYAALAREATEPVRDVSPLAAGPPPQAGLPAGRATRSGAAAPGAHDRAGHPRCPAGHPGDRGSQVPAAHPASVVAAHPRPDAGKRRDLANQLLSSFTTAFTEGDKDRPGTTFRNVRTDVRAHHAPGSRRTCSEAGENSDQPE